MTIDKDLLVYDVEAGKPLGKILTKKQFPFFQIFELPGSKRIVGWTRTAPLTIWSLPSGDVERTIDLPQRFEIKSVSFSPGGRYMSLIHDSNKILRVYDLESGQPVGELATPMDKRNQPERCLCLVFSQDGKELGGLFGMFKSRLVSWDVATGKTVVDLQFDVTLRSNIQGESDTGRRRWSGSPIAANGWRTVTALSIVKQADRFGRSPSIPPASRHGALSTTTAC
jgi:WD40 repeat protein